jgi:hypothetical protein
MLMSESRYTDGVTLSGFGWNNPHVNIRGLNWLNPMVSPQPNNANLPCWPRRGETQWRALLIQDIEGRSSLAVVCCVYEKCTYSTETFEAHRSEIQSDWKETNGAGIAL